MARIPIYNIVTIACPRCAQRMNYMSRVEFDPNPDATITEVVRWLEGIADMVESTDDYQAGVERAVTVEDIHRKIAKHLASGEWRRT